MVTALEQIYEEECLGFSYGFRPGRSQHRALDALWMGITNRPVNWVLDADISGFFDAIDHEWMLKFLQHRIGDRRILRLIRKWLRAGVSEAGQWSRSTVGTPQGAVISPLLANIYLHYVLDLWSHQWRGRKAKGAVIMVRYTADFVLGFQYREAAEQYRRELAVRLSQFGLQLHPEKTRLIEFGRRASENRRRGGAEETGYLYLPGLSPHLCERPQRRVYDPAEDRGETSETQVEEGPRRTVAPTARFAPRTGKVGPVRPPGLFHTMRSRATATP